jgi:hypothetical protein
MRRWGEWIITKIPNRLLAEPERFALALCFIIIGIDAAFLGGPTSVFGGIEKARLLNVEYGACLIVGGTAKILGLWVRRIWAVRLGAAFIIMGCLGIVIGVWLYVGEEGLPAALVYGLFALTYTLRLLSSTAARIKLHRKAKDL